LRRRELSVLELLEVYLERIQRIDARLNSFRVVMREAARAQADAAQARLDAGERSPLLGVPIAIKDNVDVAGELTTHGTGAVNIPAAADAEVVRRLRRAGAVIIGKTTMPELALWAQFTESETWGVTRNPWNPERSPGGSSGGSAVAVAAGLASAALGSDGGASIRVPAAMCGLFGFKPQRGRIPLSPYSEADFWHGLTHLGPLTRTVEDAAIFLDAVADPGTRGSSPAVSTFSEAARTPPGPLRIAMSLKPVMQTTRLDPAARRAVERTADLLASLGHQVQRANPRYPTPFAEGLPRVACGVADDAARLDNPERLEQRTQTMIRIGKLLHGRPLAWALAKERAVTARINTFFEIHDVLLTPVTALPAPPVERWKHRGALSTFFLGSTAYVAYTALWNYTGHPAASVPAGFDAHGLPLAVQLVGRHGGELMLISLAAQLEAHRPWGNARPCE
jgi:amidase